MQFTARLTASRPSTNYGQTFKATAQGGLGGVSAPSYTWTAASAIGIGLDFDTNRNQIYVTYAGNKPIGLMSTGISLASGSIVQWSSSAPDSLGSFDVAIARDGPNSTRFGATTALTTSRTELNKAVAAIADNVATAVLTVTIPNAAHSASMRVRVTGSLGAGGAIGANEATASNEYIISFTRTAGVNATAAISAAYGAAATAVAGAATVTCTAALSAVGGAVGATNTFTVNVTIVRSGGSSTNHTCLVYAQLMNANAAGITIA